MCLQNTKYAGPLLYQKIPLCHYLAKVTQLLGDHHPQLNWPFFFPDLIFEPISSGAFLSVMVNFVYQLD